MPRQKKRALLWTMLVWFASTPAGCAQAEETEYEDISVDTSMMAPAPAPLPMDTGASPADTMFLPDSIPE